MCARAVWLEWDSGNKWKEMMLKLDSLVFFFFFSWVGRICYQVVGKVKKNTSWLYTYDQTLFPQALIFSLTQYIMRCKSTRDSVRVWSRRKQPKSSFKFKAAMIFWVSVACAMQISAEYTIGTSAGVACWERTPGFPSTAHYSQEHRVNVALPQDKIKQHNTNQNYQQQ